MTFYYKINKGKWTSEYNIVVFSYSANYNKKFFDLEYNFKVLNFNEKNVINIFEQKRNEAILNLNSNNKFIKEISQLILKYNAEFIKIGD